MSVYLLAVVGEAEHHGQVQRIRPGGQRFAEHAADALDADAVPLEVRVEVALADR